MKRLVILVGMVVGAAMPDHSSMALRFGVIWYSAAPDEDTRIVAARRYGVGVTGKGDRSDADKGAIRSMNGRFEWFVYNSCSDNYTPPARSDEHDLLIAAARRHGLDPEVLYMHYFDDTRVVMNGDTLFIPGWGRGSARHPADARIPVYYSDLTRRATCFADLKGAQVHREVILSMAFDEPFDDTSLYPDGIFLDNAAARLFNFGKVISGGQVREVPGHASIESDEFRIWYWEVNLAPFLTSLTDTLEASPSWSNDGQRKRLMINVSNVWTDEYVRRDAADILFMEGQYNPIRNAGLQGVVESHRRDALAAESGILSFYAPTLSVRSVTDRAFQVGYEDALLANLSWYLVSRTGGSVLFQMGANSPNAAGWDTLTWRGCMDVADRQLGEAFGAPFTLGEGVDPTGNPYVVTAREYERGLVMVRPRGDWREGIGLETAVWVTLPAPLCQVSPSGRIGTAVGRVSLRNGEGAILLGTLGRAKLGTE